MKLGLIGLGKMGLNLAENMMDHELLANHPGLCYNNSIV